LFLTFEKVKAWKATIELTAIFPLFVSTAIFALPYGLALFVYTFELSHLLQELDLGGSLMEPDADPVDVMDLSDVTMTQSLIFLLAAPLIACIQLSDLLLAAARHTRRWLDKRRKRQERQRALQEQQPGGSKQRSLSEKIMRLFSRCFKAFRCPSYT
jgi:hypothetical protein